MQPECLVSVVEGKKKIYFHQPSSHLLFSVDARNKTPFIKKKCVVPSFHFVDRLHEGSPFVGLHIDVYVGG